MMAVSMPIDWIDVAKASATTIVTSTALSAAIVWGFKEVLSNRLKGSIGLIYDSRLAAIQSANAKELENLKSQLEAANALTLTQQSHELQLKAAEQSYSLQIKAKEFELKYSILQEKRAEMIAETYGALADILNALKRFDLHVSEDDMESETDLIKHILSEHDEAAKRELSKLNDDLTSKITTFDAIFSKRRIYFSKDIDDALEWLMNKIRFRSLEVDLFGQETLAEIMASIESEIEPALAKLAHEMRRLLGSDK